MISSIAREPNSGVRVYIVRRTIRIVLWGFAVAAILYCSLVASAILLISLGIPDRMVLFLSFPVLSLVMLFQFFSGRPVSVGWIVGATLCGALSACMIAPTISHGPLRNLWAAQYAFWGAVVGLAAGAVVGFLVVRARLRIRHLLELTVACGLVAVFWTLCSEANARNESWTIP